MSLQLHQQNNIIDFFYRLESYIIAPVTFYACKRIESSKINSEFGKIKLNNVWSNLFS